MDMFENLSAAMYSSPTNYVEAREKYKRDLQTKINETWWMASDNYEIQAETLFASRQFSPIVCRINHAINPKTGLNLGDDFKVLKFLDIDYNVSMGYRFIFDNSWWIVTNTNNYNSMTKSVVVRRCNNVLKYIYEGQIIEEPCIVDYATKYSNVYYNDIVNIPQGTIDVICQNNVNSRRVSYNDRFIFGSDVYKVKVVKDYLREQTFLDDSNPLVSFSMYVDTKSPSDDFVNGIANTDYYNSNEAPTENNEGKLEIVVSPVENTLILNEQVKYTCYLYRNDAKADDTFEFIASNVPEDCYSLVALDGNTFTVKNLKPYFKNPLMIKCKLFNSELYKDIEINLKGLY